METTQYIQNNFFWKHIDVPDHELKIIRQKYLEVLPNNQRFFQPLKIELSTFMGLDVSQTILIQVPAQTKASIHTDFRADKLKLALNISLVNCEKSITEMWECQEPPITTNTSNGIPYNYYIPNQCKKITEFTLEKPVLFNTKVPHSVFNYSNNTRLAISLRFKQDPWHLVSML